MNSLFILGSVAEVERLWSICSKVIDKDQHSMSPLMLQTILFLKVNSDYWGPSVIAKADAMRRSKRVDRKIAEEEEHDSDICSSVIYD